VVLVPNAVPGERLEVEQLRESKGIVYARIRRLVSSSPSRVVPPCPYFGDCGGCSYQHLAYEEQVRWKTAIFRETLRRIGKLTFEAEPAVHAAFPWYYRNQARLRVGAVGGETQVGFFALESHRLVKIDACRILSPCLNATVAELSQVCRRHILDGTSAVEMMADDSDRRVMLRFGGCIQLDQGERLAERMFAALPQLQTVAFEAGGKLCVVGEPCLKYRVEDFIYQISPGSFFQASRFLLPELVRTVAVPDSKPVAHGTFRSAPQEAAESKTDQLPDRPSFALDLYAGVGLFSLPLARRFSRVVAVESHSRSAADLAANARESGMRNVRAVKQTVFDFLRRFADRRPDLVILDPPRAGVGYPALRLLARLRPKSVCYVSCHPLRLPVICHF
jgi:23S rRNA (uracil1939-C5)-methyltransferase